VSVAGDLERAGISIQDRFVSAAAAGDLRECAILRETRGDFAAARIGGGGTEQRLERIRGDFTCWLQQPLLPPESALLEQMKALRLQLNRDALLALFELELHYAKYPPGAGYARHLDQPRGSVMRKVSVVLYLNCDWQDTDGGELRIHQDDGSYIDVRPVEGRLVCFLTADREHEVLTARRERLSISGWFRARQ